MSPIPTTWLEIKVLLFLILISTKIHFTTFGDKQNNIMYLVNICTVLLFAYNGKCKSKSVLNPLMAIDSYIIFHLSLPAR